MRIRRAKTEPSQSANRATTFRGFTLVELVVVVAIIGVLVALLLPAVQAAREAARRTQCASNMRQMALAVLNYESAHQILPPSGLVNLINPKADGYEIDIFNHLGAFGKRLSWMVFVLPYMEEQSLYDRFDLDKLIFDQIGGPQATLVPTFQCPSDQARDLFFEYRDGSKQVSCAKGNYAAYVSPFHVDLQLIYPGALIARGQRMEQIIGGATETLLLSEVRALDHPADQRGAWALPFAGASLLAFDMHPLGWQYLHDDNSEITVEVRHRAPYVPNPESIGKAQPPNNQGPNKDTLEFNPPKTFAEVAELAEAMAMPCTKRTLEPGVNGYISAAPRSLHPGGVNAGFLDGHIVFLRDDVDEVLMSLMVSVTDGEIQQ